MLGPKFEGYLKKKARVPRFLRNNYQRRYFVLDSQYLRYWNTKEKSKIDHNKKNKKPNIPKASIDLRSIQINSIEMLEGNTFTFKCLDLQKDSKRNTPTTLRCPYILSADTSEMAERWLKEIQYRVRNIRLTRVMSRIWADLNKGKHQNEFVLSKYSSCPSMSIKGKKLNIVRAKPMMSYVPTSTPNVLRWSGDMTKLKKSQRDKFIEEDDELKEQLKRTKDNELQEKRRTRNSF
jgi:hypothetical protein